MMQLPSNDTQVCVIVNIFNWMGWTLCVETEGGWGPSWEAGLIVGVTALAVVISTLVLLVLRSRSQAVRLFKEQQVRSQPTGRACNNNK